MNFFSTLPDTKKLISILPEFPMEPVLNVNAHFHTPYSFSSFSDIEEIFALAAKDRVDVLGINDFLTTAGYDEFSQLALKHKRFPLFNIEFMGLLPGAQQRGIRINDPNNPGRIYFCGKGLVLHNQLSTDNKLKLAQVFEESLKQVREMISRLNDHLSKIKAPFRLDFDILQKTLTKGLVRERHVVKGLRIEIRKNFPDDIKMKEFLMSLYAGKDQVTSLADINALDNEIRNTMLKKGGPAFVEENPDAFLSIESIKDIILDAGGIPCYPVLLDDEKGNFTEFEQNYEKLFNELTNWNICFIELIPGRNDIGHLQEFVDFFKRRKFLITFGTEHNTPEKIPMSITCRGNVPLTEELKRVNYESACVLAAHQFHISRGEEGYLKKNGSPDLEKKEEFVRFGNTVIRTFINRR